MTRPRVAVIGVGAMGMGVARALLAKGFAVSVRDIVVSGTQLYAVLDREFKTLRPAACTRCHVPLPYWRRPPDDVSANWQIGQPAECSHGCHLLIAELLARLWTRYDIEQQLAQ